MLWLKCALGDGYYPLKMKPKSDMANSDRQKLRTAELGFLGTWFKHSRHLPSACDHVCLQAPYPASSSSRQAGWQSGDATDCKSVCRASYLPYFNIFTLFNIFRDRNCLYSKGKNGLYVRNWSPSVRNWSPRLRNWSPSARNLSPALLRYHPHPSTPVMIKSEVLLYLIFRSC